MNFRPQSEPRLPPKIEAKKPCEAGAWLTAGGSDGASDDDDRESFPCHAGSWAWPLGAAAGALFSVAVPEAARASFGGGSLAGETLSRGAGGWACCSRASSASAAAASAGETSWATGADFCPGGVV